MEKVMIIPDVHGRTFWREALTSDADKIVFLGDYTDPYHYEGINHDQALNELVDIIQFKDENPNRVILLWGNHDFHYLHPAYRASRYDDEYFERYNALFTDDLELFQAAYFHNGTHLFTHAGVTKNWGDAHLQPGLPIEQSINDLYKTTPKAFFEVGYVRGGWHKSGSPIWADVSEHEVLLPWREDIHQIFGHSQQEKDPVFFNGNMACLDCREIFYLIDNEIIKIS